ncbi:MAG: hypothetical protein NXI31_14230 [bacterium]|nr:hypothetical protein [bacterium]
MGKWGVFSALRYLGTDRAGRRKVRPDGRPFRHPVGEWSESVRAEVRRRRSAAPQPWWPRVVGWGLVGIALLAAVKAEYPLASGVRVDSTRVLSVAEASRLVAITPLAPGGPVEGVPALFAWHTTARPPFSLVIFDAGYRELGRMEDLHDSPIRPNAELARRLGFGGTFHWFVEGQSPEGAVRSPLETFGIH